MYQGKNEYKGINFPAEIVTLVLKKEENHFFRNRKIIKKALKSTSWTRAFFSFKNKKNHPVFFEKVEKFSTFTCLLEKRVIFLLEHSQVIKIQLELYHK